MRCRSRRSPRTARKPRRWSTRSASTTDEASFAPEFRRAIRPRLSAGTICFRAMILARAAHTPATVARASLMRLRHPVASILVLGVAALVIAPLLSLIHIALEGDEDVWAHLAAYVL